jgi:gliding motility-associated-like protein
MLYGIAASAYCLGNMDSLKISVFPTPYLLHMQNDSICANQIISIPSFTACPANSTIAWANSNTSIGLGASGTGNIGSFTGLNTSNTAFNSGQIDAIPTANSCIGNDSAFVITVKPLPAMAVSTPAPYCPGDMVTSPVPTFTFSPAAGVNYNWSATNNVNIGMPASGIGPNTPATYTAPANNSLVDQTGVITYSPSLNGCLGTTVTETITIKPTPFVSPLANQFYCPNNVVPQINFVCTPSGGTPIFSYSGLGGIGIVQTGSIPSFTATNGTSLPIVSTVSVNATLNSCQGPNTSFNITVYPDPVANFSYTPACDGLPIVFANESTVGGGLSVSSWQWVLDNNGIVFSTAQNPQYTVTPAGTHSVNLLVSTSSVPSCTAQTTQLITVYPNPTVDFTGDNLKGCPSLNTQFTASASVNPGTITGYSWSFGNGQSSSSQTPSSQVFPNGSATAPMYYNVSLMVTTDKGCTAMQTKNNYVEVYPKPIAGFAWNPKNTDITAPTIEFVNQAIGASTYSPALTYGQYGVEYYLGDTYLPDNASNYVYNNSFFNHSYNDPDLSDNYEYYTVTQWVINKYGCTDSIMERVEILPIVTFYIPNAFTPNNDGTDDGFKGTGIGIDNSTYNLWIFDRWGLMIYHAQDLEQVWDGHMRGHEGQPILQEDVYVWKVNFNDIFGKQHEYHGTVTLIK